MAPKKTPPLLSVYAAAARIGMSPVLLRTMTERQVKWKDKRKLLAAEEREGTLYFAQSELDDFNEWLKEPWPSEKGKRPAVPDFIRHEIRLEASMECALCGRSGEAGEAAHIDPVHRGKNNHPHNLIWLCANHHTKFDNGLIGPKGCDNEVVAGLKLGLLHFRKFVWQGQANISQHIASTLGLCVQWQKRVGKATDTVEKDAYERFGKKLLELLPELASKGPATGAKSLAKLATELKTLDQDPAATTDRRVAAAARYEEEYLLESAMKKCPLCKGATFHNGYECPICQGAGAVPKGLKVDLEPFEMVDCPLCCGRGTFQGEECPICHGDCQMEQHAAERVDVRMFDVVPCPLCNGDGTFRGEDCPVCHGDCELPRHAADQVDPRAFQEVDCPVCSGSGTLRGGECRACSGDRRMLRADADNFDPSDFDLVDCPLCEGSGEFLGNDCLVCRGECQLTSGDADKVSRSDYKLVPCPHCRGRGQRFDDDCHTCDGRGKLPRIVADQLD